MSLRLIADAFDYAPYKDGTLVVLMALASWANDDGTRIFPSIETLAAKARRSVRSTQYALRQLEDDGVLEVVAEGNGRHTTEYRLVMEEIRRWTQNVDAENEGCKNCTPDEDETDAQADVDEGCKICTPEVQPAAPQRCNHCTPEVQLSTSYIDKPVIEPVIEPVTLKRASARKSERRPKGSQNCTAVGTGHATANPSAAGHPLMAAWGDIWAGYGAVPGFSPAMSEARAKAAMKALIRDGGALPDPADLIAAIGVYARDVAAANATRRKPMFIPHPHTWLGERRWQQYLEPATASRNQATCMEAKARAAADGLGEAGFGKLIAAGLSMAEIAAWFDGAVGETGETGPVIRAASAFRAREIEKRFLGKLRGAAAFGPQLIIAVRA